MWGRPLVSINWVLYAVWNHSVSVNANLFDLCKDVCPMWYSVLGTITAFCISDCITSHLDRKLKRRTKHVIHIWLFYVVFLFQSSQWTAVSSASDLGMKVKKEGVYCYCAMKSKNTHQNPHEHCVICNSIDSMTDAVKELNAKLRSLNDRAMRNQTKSNR